MGKGRRHNGNSRPDERRRRDRRAGRPTAAENYRPRSRLRHDFSRLPPSVSRMGGQNVVMSSVSTLGQRAQRGCPCENPGPMALFFVAFLIFLPGAIMTANGYGEPEAIARRDPLLIVGPVSIGVSILLMLLSCGWNLYIQNNEGDSDLDVELGESDDLGPASPDPASFSPPPSYDTIVHEDENRFSFPDQPTSVQEEEPGSAVPSPQASPRIVLRLVEIPNNNDSAPAATSNENFDPWVARVDAQDEDIVHPPPSYAPVATSNTTSSDPDDVFEEDEDLVHPPPSYDEVMHVVHDRRDDV